MISFIGSLAIVVIDLIRSYRIAGGFGIGVMLAFLAIPLSCIWFSVIRSGGIGWVGIPIFGSPLFMKHLDTDSPALAIKILGWILLIGVSFLGPWLLRGIL